MTCEDFRRLYEQYTDFPVPREVWDTPEGREWTEHSVGCAACSDWGQALAVERSGARVEDYPCVHMAYFATFRCDEHEDLRLCSKAPILHDAQIDEYRIGARGGTGDSFVISHCPWCGAALNPPRSRPRTSPES